MKAKTIAAQVNHFADLCQTYFDQGAQALHAYAHAVGQMAELEGLTPQHCAAVVQSYDWADNLRDCRKLSRIARAICEVKPSQRTARINAILMPADNRSHPTLGSCEAVVMRNEWGGHKVGERAGAGRKKGTTTAKGTAKDSEAVTGLRKLTTAALIEFVAQRCAKSPDFRAKLLAAINAETVETETE